MLVSNHLVVGSARVLQLSLVTLCVRMRDREAVIAKVGPQCRRMGLVPPGQIQQMRFGFNDLEFTATPTLEKAIDDQWEVGAAIGRRNSPIPIWFLKFDRLGLGYRTSSNGDLKGITFVFRSFFDD